MRARVPYALVGDVGFYQRSEIKDALALLRLAMTPDDAQADEAFRRVINVPARGFGAKAMDILDAEAAWRRVSLLAALETAPLPPKARAAGLGFGDAIFTGKISDIALPGGQRNADHWFNVNAGFNRNPNDQRGSDIRTFPLRFSGVRATLDRLLNQSLAEKIVLRLNS